MLTTLFSGLDVLVARDEGLFEAEGVDLRIATLPPSAPRRPESLHAAGAVRTVPDRAWLDH
jgi:hypothetical protein